MNNALPITTSTSTFGRPAADHLTKIAAAFAQLFKTLAVTFAPGDDPAALRYIASKYNGEGD